MNAPKCRRGDLDMEEGYLPDWTYGGRLVPQWVPGKPKRSFWMGLKLPVRGVPVRTFRCAGCGLLESYAQP